jgi:hypothetical protein
LVFTLKVCQYVFYRWAHERKQAIGKNLVSNLWFVGNIIINGFTNGKGTPKNYLLYSVGIFLREFGISPTETPYAIPSVIKQ